MYNIIVYSVVKVILDITEGPRDMESFLSFLKRNNCKTVPL